MTDRSTRSEAPPARAQADLEIQRVLQQEMMSRRFITDGPHRPRQQSGVLLVFIGVLLLLVLQQVMISDPVIQTAHQQRGVSTTGAIGPSVSSVWERNDP